ncbi:sensor histidine kinase [Photobacterium nomapromontoriensis]|uniref:sensor histidine kinase n=1 Tax=Photobacterium nomapromontoriensis TaxID=2910237 RepID=UPI003D0E6E19
MFFVSRDVLYRSFVYKVLMYTCLGIAIFYGLIVHMVYFSSESFHASQLERELIAEYDVFSQLVSHDSNAVYDLIEKRQQQGTPFSYSLIPSKLPSTIPQPVTSYPALLSGTGGNDSVQPHIVVDDVKQLVIGIDPKLLKTYRDTLMPMLLTGVLLPAVVMLCIATIFALNIIGRIQRVNSAMNRVLCGEKQVKLPISRDSDEFDILAIHLNFLIEQVEKNENALKALTTGLAHDLRTPIARMRLRIDSLMLQDDEQGNTSDKFHQELAACSDDLERMLSLFNGMLEIANLNCGKSSMQKKTVSLYSICTDVVEFLLPLADQKYQKITLRKDASYTMQGEPTLLFRAVFNLLENAIKFSSEGSEIEVVVDHFGLVVCDLGIGIEESEKQQVCEPMYRCDCSRTTEGDGLGLALVAAVLKRHNGTLVLSDNQPGLRARMMFECRV